MSPLMTVLLIMLIGIIFLASGLAIAAQLAELVNDIKRKRRFEQIARDTFIKAIRMGW